MSTEHESVTLRRLSEGLVLVTLNRPAAMNAVNAELANALEAVVAEVEADEEVRAAVITGAGEKAFSAGADLKEVAAGKLGGTFTAAGGFAGFVNAPRKKLWVAAVNGLALAGGFEIVLACDLIVASSEARFGLPEVTRGLIASAGGLYRLPRALPRAVATELIVTGSLLDAERAYALGLINRVVPAGQAVTEAIALSHSICANAPLAVLESLAIARAASGFDDPELREAGDTAQTRLAQTSDYREGSQAFVEKRKPSWTAR
jgi:enoyl-CoA hydratase